MGCSPSSIEGMVVNDTFTDTYQAPTSPTVPPLHSTCTNSSDTSSPKCKTIANIILEGYVIKKSTHCSYQNPRYIIIKDSGHLLVYHTKKIFNDNHTNNHVKGYKFILNLHEVSKEDRNILLKDAVTPTALTILIKCKTKKIELMFEDEQKAQHWLETINKRIWVLSNSEAANSV